MRHQYHSTNHAASSTSCDKAQMIAATVERLKDMVGDLVEAPYVVHETDIGTWGYDHATPPSTGGLQPAARQVNFRVGKLYKIG